MFVLQIALGVFLGGLVLALFYIVAGGVLDAYFSRNGWERAELRRILRIGFGTLLVFMVISFLVLRVS